MTSSMIDQGFRNYLTVTGGYWAFTITDGAIRMLVVLYFHGLGYSPLEIAMLFLFYEFFGIITNLLGGWLGSRIGLNLTMHIGMVMQITALLMLTLPDAWLSVAYVMLAQAISGIAKDLNKMSAKAGVKLFVPDQSDAKLFRWVAMLTGSKNALKGVGFFIGASLLAWIGFRGALFALAAMLFFTLIITYYLLPRKLGKSKIKTKLSQVFSTQPQTNWLSIARFFLFGARDIWFVVALPVFLQSQLAWTFTQVGTFLALWIIGYGFFQTIAPQLISAVSRHKPGASTLVFWAGLLIIAPIGIAVALQQGWDAEIVLIIGLTLFAILFAMNSATHSYLIVAWSEHERVSMNVGFYYMANAGGRLTGTVLSGLVYQQQGLEGCLYWSAAFILAALLASMKLQRMTEIKTV